MKTEFLKELGLEKDVIDKIMAENGKDVGAEKAKTKEAEADRDSYKGQLETARGELEKFKDADPEEMQATIDRLNDDLKKKDEEHEAEKADRVFREAVREAIAASGGRNEKAVMAMLDIGALKESKNQKDDIKAALDEVRKENGYLFKSDEPIKNPTGPTGGGAAGGGSSALRAAMGLPSEE